MSTIHTKGGPDTEQPVITRRDIDAYVREGKRLRAEETSKLLRAVGSGFVRLAHAVAGLARSRGLGDASTTTGAHHQAHRGFTSGGFGQPTRA